MNYEDLLYRARRWRALIRPSTISAAWYDINLWKRRDPGSARILQEGFIWLARAQDRSTSADGGIARHFSLVSGWSSSYPETTGYILNTWFERLATTKDRDFAARIGKALAWLSSIQLADGGFPGGVVGSGIPVPVVFNTGQIVLGLAESVHQGYHTGDSLIRAANWLLSLQEDDGSWQQGARLHAPGTARTYDTHVAWGLFAASAATGQAVYAEAARKNIEWTLKNQQPNGWFAECSLWGPERTLTHTLAYALRGVVEGFHFTREERWLAAAQKTADAFLSLQKKDGSISGCFDSKWKPTASWICLTGLSQIALCWMRLYELTGDSRYFEAALPANAFVRRTMHLGCSSDESGGVLGSYPMWGDYCTYQYVNWAAKFTLDANMLEEKLLARLSLQAESPLP